MRNKIKYAGISAIVLLTAAPMITSSLSSATIQASPVVDANVSSLVNSKVNVADIKSADLQYPTETTVEEGSLVSDSVDDNRLYNYKLVSTDDNSKGQLIGIADKIQAPMDQYHSSPDMNPDSLVEMGDTYTSENPVLYRQLIVRLDKSAGEFASKYAAGQATMTTNGLAENPTFLGEGNEDMFVFNQKVTVVPKGTAKEISGVAITNSDKAYYHLYNDKNEELDHRALSANTHWQVDQVRTINGIKQYRVSTHEWVNASDVTFLEHAELPKALDITNLQELQKIDIAEGASQRLYNANLESSSTRALGGGTSWLVDKIGVDESGAIYYGVSTNEFVKAGNGVTLVNK
ncbi:hypothetical protein [Companilactobacillus kedongensis]|uniref:hypothetical protein n=1 Tax=Companilactobacillus kedongensis TaxID=2486004 RepID=UPI000F79F565|nr:hypothetical protein [Companilactobacillus kedongensis]